jgi:type II secretory pathway pseudopilin PulG
MKQKTHRDLSAFTLVEVIVLIVIIGLLAVVFLPTMANRSLGRPHSINCVDNLKEIGEAYRLWANDNGDLWPFQQTISNGGWADLLITPIRAQSARPTT